MVCAAVFPPHALPFLFVPLFLMPARLGVNGVMSTRFSNVTSSLLGSNQQCSRISTFRHHSIKPLLGGLYNDALTFYRLACWILAIISPTAWEYGPFGSR